MCNKENEFLCTRHLLRNIQIISHITFPLGMQLGLTGFPNSSVIKNPLANTGDLGWFPKLGIST